LPQDHKRKIGTTRIVTHGGKRAKVETDTLAWATFYRQAFNNEWSDEEVIAQLQPHLGSSNLVGASVVRGLRKAGWECSVQMQFESPEAAKMATKCLRAGGFHAGACKSTAIVDQVLHNIGIRVIFGWWLVVFHLKYIYIFFNFVQWSSRCPSC